MSKSADEIKNAHSYTQNRDKRGKSVSDYCCAPDDASKACLVGLDGVGPDGSDVGSRADKEKHYDNHAIETEEGALYKEISTMMC